MPTIASNKQPTIAVITAQYCEKIAVDAMLENKETFVRYTTVGKLIEDFPKLCMKSLISADTLARSFPNHF